MNRYVVVAECSPEIEAVFTNHFKGLPNVEVWHWLQPLWLVFDKTGQLDIYSLHRQLRKIAPDTEFYIDMSQRWVGRLDAGGNDWLRDNWGAKPEFTPTDFP